METHLPLAAVHEGSLLQIEASNICEGGAYCRSEAPLDVMTRMEVRFDLPPSTGRIEPETVHVGAIVVRCEPHPVETGIYNLALFFSSIDESARERLAAFVVGRRNGDSRSAAARQHADG